jgi:hypothetical protein
MNELLQEAIAGEPVLVKLGGREYRLSFPVAAVILYKKETAILDRERARLREGPRLTPAEIRDFRRRWQKLLAEAQTLRPGKGPSGEDLAWDDENFAQYQLLLEEANLLRVAVDENAGTGDSLYDRYTWQKISPDGDPERLLLALWVGLHKFEDGKYIPQISRAELGTLHLGGNGPDLTMKIVKALAADILAAREASEETENAPLPNVPAPGIPAAIPVTEKPVEQATEKHQTTPWKQRQP